jgi:V8-like Glu-specific endopeptidase
VSLALTPADPVSVIGFPFGQTAGGSYGVWATGFIASELAINFNNLPVQLIDSRTRPGQSGSPVIAHRNGGLVALDDGSSALHKGPVARFVGIYSGRINKKSDIGIVWKAYAIQELLASIK